MSSAIGAETPSNLRPLTIFTSYILLCLTLTLLILHTIFAKARPLRSYPRGSRLFAALAVFSLAVTWYFMLCFFAHSYRTWASSSNYIVTLGSEPGGRMPLGAWLRDSKLFKEAWGSAMATPGRFWWSQQIFYGTAGWSVFIGREGHRRRIPHLWAFMLLGQVVAISFASNLFLLAVVLSPLPDSPSTESGLEKERLQSKYAKPPTWTPPLLLLIPPIILSLLIPSFLPPYLSTSLFLPLLLIPHLLLFIPPLLPSLLPASWGTAYPSIAATEKLYSNLYSCIFFFWAMATAQGVWLPARGVNMTEIFEALYEHPAVSSVAWDVMLCSVTLVAWMWVQRGMGGGGEREQEGLEGSKVKLGRWWPFVFGICAMVLAAYR
ncbi:hypothetical protein K432DRAFT_329046 [Lepidopterella palustris CBS 459.81]|uniref:Uncharacterized protein n=1 Tax=Lepidopterella palustris CBS 459.81 TaxID=1314670 RepID=A0A8E2JEU5_9PEZI|nr:hypothetical protein K432DRAFT_329046 [Lepidopterella palustris CBS 459.81]